MSFSDANIYLCVALFFCAIVALAFAGESFFLRQEARDWRDEATRWRFEAERLAWKMWGPNVEEREHIPEEVGL